MNALSDTACRPGVTVIVPAYNAAPFIERTLLSALGQNYAPLALLLIDDGSTDDTRAIAERLAAGHPNLRVISTANRGVAEARNWGIAEADTPYVAFLDADDLWNPTKIAKQVAALAAHGDGGEWGACYALSRLIDPEDRVVGANFATAARGDIFREHLRFNHMNNGSCLLVRRDLARAVGGFNPQRANDGIGGVEDYEFQLRIARAARIELVREYLVGYRVYPGQMSHDPMRMALGRIAAIEAAIEGSDLSPGEVRHLRVFTRLLEARRRFLVGQPLRAARALARALVAGPADLARHLAERIEIGAARRRAPRAASLAPELGLPFLDVDPAAGIPPPGDFRTHLPATLQSVREQACATNRSEAAPAGRTPAD